MSEQYTGSDDELHDILGCWDSHERLAAWRDAAVARFLAEAGAVHPQVHTPNRVMRWLSEHGWERFNVSDIAVAWRHLLGDGRVMNVYVPTNPKTVDYARQVRALLEDGAFVAGMPTSMQVVLADVAALPDEVTW